MALLVRCTRCRREVDASLLRDATCRRCRVGLATASERTEYQRLNEKRERYRRRGGATEALDRQIDRVWRRMLERARDILPPGESPTDALTEALDGDDAEEPQPAPQLTRPAAGPRRTDGGIILP